MLSCAEAFCDRGWLRPLSKVATGQDSCKGGSEGFYLVLATAGSGHSSPGCWHGLSHRMASVLIRNAGKRLVPFSKELSPSPSPFPLSSLGVLVQWNEPFIIIYSCLFMGILEYVLTSQAAHGRVHSLQHVFLGVEVPPLSSLPVPRPANPQPL